MLDNFPFLQSIHRPAEFPATGVPHPSEILEGNH
jgi:hypothetical protein